MLNKVLTLLGFAQKSNKLVTGENTCELYIKRKAVHLLIIASDVSKYTLEKFAFLCEKNNIPYFVFGEKEQLSKAIGKINRGVFGIKDKTLADNIKEILESLSR